MNKLLSIFAACLLVLAVSLPVAFEMIEPSTTARAACGSSLCVQANTATNGGAGTTRDVAFMSSQAAGNLNIVGILFCNNLACDNDTSGVTISVTDDSGNTYQLAANLPMNSNQRRIAVYYAANIIGGSNAVHISLADGSTPSYLSGNVSEWSGITTASPLDKTGTADTSGANPTVSTSVATTQATELVYGLVHSANSATSGSTAINGDGGTFPDQYKTVSSTGVQSISWTASSGFYGAIIATFKQSAGGGGGGSAGRMLLLGIGR